MRRSREIESKVAELLLKHGIGEAPVRVDKIASAEGIPVVESSLGGEVSGALLRSSGMAGIAVNAKQSPVRKRFTIAHELAHFMLDHTTEDHIDWQFTILRRDQKSSEASDAREIEANAFAANLLMPKEFIKADLQRYCNYRGELNLDESTRQTLARKYMVSLEAMTFRLMNLGFMAPT